jgi:outer membrane immunogenic protein
VEGELSTSGGDTQFPSSFTGARDGLKAGGQYYLGARAGFALTPGIAAYGKVGYTSLSTKAFTSSGSLAELKENTGGLRFGGGVQVALPGPLEARLEYRRSRYKDVVDGTYGDATTDQVVAGLGVRF